METLDEQLAKLTMMMERDLSPKPGMGPKKVQGPTPPPKPKKPQPQVPKSYNVNKSCEPSYSTLLQSSSSNGSSYEQPPPPPAPSHNVYSNITTNNMTLDNPAILEQQKKALEHHKKILEAQNRKMTPTPPPEQINSTGSIYENQKNSQIYSKKPEGLIYSNIIHSSGNMRRMTEPKPPVNFYSNIPYNSGSSHLDDIPPPAPLDIQVPAGFTDAEDDLPPPPSPVSSSYSELRRATDINGYPPVPTYPPQDYQPFNQVHQMAHLPPNDLQVYSNNYQPDYTYGLNSQGSSTYESIYEPINPRPPSQLSTRSNYSLYAPYVSGSQTSKMSNQKEAEVDALTDMLVQSLDESPDGDTYGICCKCDQRVVGENSGCTAMDQVYHITCFTCYQCQINLQGKPFYSLDGKPYCEEDYVNTLEKCSVCVKPILERILRATGKPYHPGCFCCVVCGKSLDGIPFTVDATNQIHCIEDFHKKFAPRCCVCRLPIMPEPGKEETVRVVALDRSFHISCYKCEDCGLLLSSEAEGRGCYPLDDHVLCKSCNAKRVQLLTSHMTTEL